MLRNDDVVRLLPTSHMSLSELKDTRNKLIAAAARAVAFQGILLEKEDPKVQGLLKSYATAIQKREEARARK